MVQSLVPFWNYCITDSKLGSVGKSCHNCTMCDPRLQMHPNLPNQAEIRAANDAPGRIRFHLIFPAGDLQRNAPKMSVDGGLSRQLAPQPALYQRPLGRSRAASPKQNLKSCRLSCTTQKYACYIAHASNRACASSCVVTTAETAQLLTRSNMGDQGCTALSNHAPHADTYTLEPRTVVASWSGYLSEVK